MPEAKDLYEQLDQQHPDYVEWSRNWRLYRDLLGDAEPDLQNYLPRGDMESSDLYAIRLSLAEFIPESPIAVNKIIEAVYDKRPVRDFKTPAMRSWAMNVDRRGTNIDDFAERMARRLVGYGTTRLLINVRPPDTPVPLDQLTVADTKALNVMPYALNYSPLAITDWEVDRYQRLTRIRIKESFFVKSLKNLGHDMLHRFIEYDTEKSTYWEFREELTATGYYQETITKQPIHGTMERSTGKLTVIVDGIVTPHNLGVVPMIIENYPDEIRPMIGAGFIRWMGKADKRKIQVESDLHYDTYLHAHPAMVYKGLDALGEVGIGAHSYLKIKRDDDLFYLQLPPSVAEQLMRVIDMNMQSMYRHAGTDPLGVLQPGSAVFETSGVSRAWSFGTSEARKLKDVALKMQRIETKMFSLVERWTSPSTTPIKDPEDMTFEGRIQYPEEYDPSSTVVLMDNTERASVMVPSQTLGKLLEKRIAASLAGEVPHDLLKKILEEIEKNPVIGFSAEQPLVQSIRTKMTAPPQEEEEEEHKEMPAPMPSTSTTPPSPTRRPRRRSA